MSARGRSPITTVAAGVTALSLIFATVVSFAILFLPGAAVAVAFGARRLTLVAAAPVVSVSLISVAALVAPMIGMRWSLAPTIALSLLATACAYFVRRYVFRRRLPLPLPEPRLPAVVIVATVVASTLLVLRFLVALPAPDAFAGTFDNVFHLNAIRYALDSGSASPLTIGRLSAPDGALGFYPSAWHATAALVVSATGVTVPVAVNAMTLVSAAVVFPIGMLLFGSSILGPGRAQLIGTVLAAAAAPTYPYLLVVWGSLYPLLFAIAFVPAAAALSWRCLVTIRRREPWAALWLLCLQVLVAPGIAVAHPGGALVWLSMVAVMVCSELLRAAVTAARRRRVGLCVTAAGVAGLWLGVLQLIRPPASQLHWQATQSVSQAIGELSTLAMNEWPMDLPLALLVLIGVVTSSIRRTPGTSVLFWTYALLGGLFVIAAGGLQVVRIVVTGPWYTDIARISSFIVLAAAPLAGAGVAAIWSWGSRHVLRGSGSRRTRVATVGMVVLLTLLTQAAVFRPTTLNVRGVMTPSASSDAVSPDELRLMHRLDSEVPPSAGIVADPWSGAAFAYAVADRRVFPAHLLYTPTADQSEILQYLNSPGHHDQVCRALQRTDTRFVLSFGGPQIGGADHSSDSPGLLHLDRSGMVTLVDRVGAARLYRITGC